MTSSRRPSIAERLSAEPAPAWRPENPGDAVIGELIAVTSHDAGWGPYRVLELRLPDGGTVAVHAFHTVLRQELASQRPQLGETLGIRWAGKVQSPSGSYHAYRLVVDRANAEVDWSADGDGPGPLASSSQAPPASSTHAPGSAPTLYDDDPDIPF